LFSEEGASESSTVSRQKNAPGTSSKKVRQKMSVQNGVYKQGTKEAPAGEL